MSACPCSRFLAGEEFGDRRVPELGVFDHDDVAAGQFEILRGGDARGLSAGIGGIDQEIAGEADNEGGYGDMRQIRGDIGSGDQGCLGGGAAGNSGGDLSENCRNLFGERAFTNSALKPVSSTMRAKPSRSSAARVRCQ